MSSLSTDQTTLKSCSKCGAVFGCGMTSANAQCWCMELPHVAPVAALDQDCLCPNCLTKAITKFSLVGDPSTERPTSDAYAEVILVEGEDYYLEGAAMVFTTSFLLRRGYCCESGCRHCPFDTTAVTPTARIKDV